MIKPECRLTGITVVLPLDLGVIDVLSRQLVLQLDRDHGNTVHGQHHVDGILTLFRIMPLPNTLEDVLLITLDSDIIQGRLRLEEADLELHTAMLEAVPQDGKKAVHHHSVFKALVELLVRIGAALPLEPLSHVRLRCFHEPD